MASSASEDMPTHPVHIPQEIVDQIIDHVQGGSSRNVSNRTLKTCALISRSWKHRSQQYLYRCLVLIGGYAGQVKRLAELMDSPLEGVTCHIRTVVINLFGEEGAMMQFLGHRDVMKVLNMIFRGGERRNGYSLSLRLWKSSGFQLPTSFDATWTHGKSDWRLIPKDFNDLLLKVIKKGMLKHLQLSHFINIPKFFLEISTLESIGFNSMAFKFTRMPYLADVPSGQANQDDEREMLFLKAFDIPDSIHSGWDFSGVKALCCTLSYPVDWLDTFMMLRGCSSSLESLTIIVNPHANTSLDNVLRDVLRKMGNNRLQLEKLKKLTITNSGENIPKDTSTLPDAFWERSPPMYETFRVLQLLELDMWVVGSDPLTLGGNTPCAPLESPDIHITLGSNSLVKVHIPRALRRVVKFSSIMRRSKVVTMHFFIPQLVRDAGDMDRDNEHLLKLAKTLRERLHDEAIMGEIALVRSNIGPFRPVVDIGLPDVDVLGSNDNYRTYSLFDTSIE